MLTVVVPWTEAEKSANVGLGGQARVWLITYVIQGVDRISRFRRSKSCWKERSNADCSLIQWQNSFPMSFSFPWPPLHSAPGESCILLPSFTCSSVLSWCMSGDERWPLAFPNFAFSDFTLVAWSWPWWEHLHHRHQQMLQIRTLPPNGFLNIYQHLPITA